MSLKMMLVAALALVMVSCGGGGAAVNPALQKKSASASFKAISALGPSIFGSLLSNKPRLQGETKTVELTCTTGDGTVTSTVTNNSFALVLKTSASGCTTGDTTITAPAGLTMTFTGSGDIDTTFTFTLEINGGATITTGSSTEKFSYNKFSIKIEGTKTGTAQNPGFTATITINGSVTTTTDGTQTFDNVKYTDADLN